MTKAAVRQDKYYLRDIHGEIDLYDRKLSYLQKYVDFPSDTDRQEAMGRLLAKRALLERTARDLVALGVEYREDELPRSFRVQEGPRETSEENAAENDAVAPVVAPSQAAARKK